MRKILAFEYGLNNLRRKDSAHIAIEFFLLIVRGKA